MTLPWLILIGLIPLVGAAAIMAVPALGRMARSVALVTSLLTFGVTVAMAANFDVARADEFQFAVTKSWIPQFGASFAVAVDGIGLSMIVMSTLLVPLCIGAAWKLIETERSAAFYAWILVLETFMVGVFAARDVFLFYVFFEAMLIPVYFLIGNYGGEGRRYAATKFLLYSLAGGLLMLVAVVAVYMQGPGGAQGFLVDNLIGLKFSSVTAERLMFLGFFIAFAVKAPMWPLHTWLPDAAGEAPAEVSTLLVGVLDKVGTFGMLVLVLPLFPNASAWAAPTIIVLALISVIYGAILAIGQRDLMRLIAFTSISHFGFIVMGIFAFTSTSQSGAMLYMVNHGFSTAALFLVAGMLIRRRGSAYIEDFGGLQRSTPMLAAAFFMAGMSGLALPGLSSFISEITVLVGIYATYPTAALIGVFAIVLAALYILLTYQRMFTGPEQDFAREWKDLNAREVWVIAPIVFIIIAMGVFPKPVTDLLNPAANRTMHQIGVEDLKPTVPAEAAAEGSQP